MGCNTDRNISINNDPFFFLPFFKKPPHNYYFSYGTGKNPYVMTRSPKQKASSATMSTRFSSSSRNRRVSLATATLNKTEKITSRSTRKLRASTCTLTMSSSIQASGPSPSWLLTRRSFFYFLTKFLIFLSIFF